MSRDSVAGSPEAALVRAVAGVRSYGAVVIDGINVQAKPWLARSADPDGQLRAATLVRYIPLTVIYTDHMTKRLVDIDEHALDAARAGLGTHTIKDTVNEALRRAAENRRAAVKKSLDVLARADLVDREEAWR